MSARLYTLLVVEEEVEHLLLEGQKAKRKLQKVLQRRDHYARLYYQAILELDATQLELSRARLEINELRAQGIQYSDTSELSQ